MNTEAQKNAFIAKHRNLAKAVIEMKALNDEYVATDAGNVIVDTDFAGVNEGITTADMISFQASIVAPIMTILDGVGVETVAQNYKNV